MKTNKMFLVSYCPTSFIDDVLVAKSTQLVSYAYILHDKDVYLEDVYNADGTIKHHKGEKEINHTHIYLSLKMSREVSEICGWFKGCKDENGLTINTLAEKVLACQSAIDYLTHKNQPNKYQYPVSEVIYGGNVQKDDNGNLITLETTMDDSADIVDCLLTGVPLKQILRIFGKDFLYHYSSYKAFVNDVIQENNQESEMEYLRNECDRLTLENAKLNKEIILRSDSKYFTQEVINNAFEFNNKNKK